MTDTLRVAVLGAAGRMGRQVCSAVQAAEDMVLVARLDVVALAGSLIDAADVSQAIRASTGSLASGAVRGARVQGAQTYGQVQRVVDRVPLLRREQEPEADPESQTAP
jgi:hypothetical protein